MTIEGQSASQFLINANTCNSPLAPAQSCEVTVAFHPTTVGDKVAELAVTATTGTRLTASLAGSAVCPAGVIVTPAVVNFEDASTTTPPAVPPRRTVTVANRLCTPFGPLNLQIVGPDAASFQLEDRACVGRTLPGNEDCVSAVLFKPTSAGLKEAQLQVSVGVQVSLTVLLSGMGL